MNAAGKQGPAPTLAAAGLTLGYGRVPVVHDVDLALQPGEVVGLLGPNGAGKSTLLRGLAGLQPALGGEVRLDGQALARLGRRRRARLLAYVEQTTQLHWPMAVRDVVALGRLPHQRSWQGPAAQDIALVNRAMAMTDIADMAGRPANQLSGGEQMRTVLARALAGEPRIILADEPIAALDPAHQLSIMELLASHADTGGTVAVALHDLVAAGRFCHRVVVLEDGRVHSVGPPSDVLTEATMARVFRVETARPVIDGVTIAVPWRPLADP
jgi:iron complex transport system ATP-binding protein